MDVKPKTIKDIKPLTQINLPVLGPLDPMGLTLIVGPNSSGKSLLLRDIRNQFQSHSPTLVVAESIKVDFPDVNIFTECLVNSGLAEVRQHDTYNRIHYAIYYGV